MKVKVPESAGFPGLSVLTTPTDPGNAKKIVLSENGVVEGQERGALPLSEGVGQEGVRGVAATVKTEADGGGAGIVGVLNELLQHRRPLRVVQKHLADPPREVYFLTPVF